jgi:hypothetical protein
MKLKSRPMATPPICFNLTDIARDRTCLACRYHPFRLAGEVAFALLFHSARLSPLHLPKT